MKQERLLSFKEFSSILTGTLVDVIPHAAVQGHEAEV